MSGHNSLFNSVASTPMNADQIRGLINSLREIRTYLLDLTKTTDYQPNFYNNLPPDFCWANFYSYSFPEMLGAIVWLGDAKGQIVDAAKHGKILEALESIDFEIRDIGKGLEYSQYGFTAGIIALLKSLSAIEQYGKSINRMVFESLHGRPDMLLEAIRLDHSVISNKDVARLFAVAELKDNKVFMKKVARSLMARPKKRTKGLAEFRFAVVCLHETGQLATMTGEEKYELLAKELKLYASNNDDPAAMLKYIRDMKLSSRT